MNVAQRREEILNLLKNTDEPISAKSLAARFSVTRQVIVQDIAVLKASNDGLISTHYGYLFQKPGQLRREIKVCHTPDQARQELQMIVDGGGHVLNVSISHRAYGKISTPMDIASKKDIDEFMESVSSSKSTLLSSATSGYHYHLIEASSQERLDAIEKSLQEAGMLVPLSAWEQENQKKD
jgi:hypothetical protein